MTILETHALCCPAKVGDCPAMVEAIKPLERLVRAALALCPSEGVYGDEPRMDYDEVQIDKDDLAEFRAAVSEYETVKDVRGQSSDRPGQPAATTSVGHGAKV